MSSETLASRCVTEREVPLPIVVQSVGASPLASQFRLLVGGLEGRVGALLPSLVER